jgi:hypothetical protein
MHRSLMFMWGGIIALLAVLAVAGILRLITKKSFQVLIDVVFFLVQSLILALILTAYVALAGDVRNPEGYLFTLLFVAYVEPPLLVAGIIGYRLWKNSLYRRLCVVTFGGFTLLILTLQIIQRRPAATLAAFGSSAISAAFLSLLLAMLLWQLITFIPQKITKTKTQ